MLVLVFVIFIGISGRVCVDIVVVVLNVSSRTSCNNWFMCVGNVHNIAEDASGHLFLGMCRAYELSFKEE